MRTAPGMALAAAVLAATSCAASTSDDRAAPSPSSPAPPAATDVSIYTPFGPGGQLAPGLRVTGHASGQCQPSNVLQRTDAYRCFLNNNEISDPCFSSEQGWLACDVGPGSTDVLQVTPQGQLPANSQTADPTSGNAWILQLSNGQNCGFMGGATEALNNMRLNYGCPNGADLFGDPDKSTSVWTIYYRPRGGTSITKIGVSKAWY